MKRVPLRRMLPLGALALAVLGAWRWSGGAGADAAVRDDTARPVAVAASGGGTARTPAHAGVSATTLFRIADGGDAARAAGADASVPVVVDRQAALQAARTGAVEVVLPDGRRYPLRHERSESAPGGNWTFVGRVMTPVGDLASVITFGRDGVFGTLPTPDGTMLKLTTRGGQVFLQPAGWRVPPGADPSRDLDYVMPREAPAGAVAPAAASPAAPVPAGAADDDGIATISILAVYTRNLVQLRGSRSAAQTEYRNLVAVMNQAHIDSGTRARFEIARFAEVDYPATAMNEAAREDIEANTMPDGTDLHALREAHLADLVAMIRPYVVGDLTCGISQFPGQELSGRFVDGSTGFSVTAVEACTPLVYAHEIGHNLGLMHDRETVAGPHGGSLAYGPFRYSFGYRQVGPPGFATVMAYDSDSRPEIGIFSHPGSTLCAGVACGDAATADNVRTINELAGLIAAFRQPAGILAIRDRLGYESGALGGLEAHASLNSPAPAGGVSFDVQVVGGTATWGADVALQDREGRLDRLHIPAGKWNVPLALRIVDDDEKEGPETLVLRLANVDGDVVVPDDTATITLIDNDDKVRVSGNLRFPEGVERPGTVQVTARAHLGDAADVQSRSAQAPDYAYAFDAWEGSVVTVQASASGLRAQRAVVERVDGPLADVDIRFHRQVPLTGRLKTPGGQGVPNVPVIAWNARGDGHGYYANLSGGGFAAPLDLDVMAGMAMQLEVRDPPAPYVRQIVEVPPLSSASTRDVTLRTVPSLTIPHVTVAEGAAADGDRTVVLTASLSVPGASDGVSFDVVPVGTADADDYHLPKTHITIPNGRTRVDIPVVIRGDDVREGTETIELRITNLKGAAWNPGPGSLRIATDDGQPGDGRCTGSEMRMCE